MRWRLQFDSAISRTKLTIYELSVGSNLHHLWFRTDGCRIPTLSSSAIFGTSDWFVISGVGGVILGKNTGSSVSNPWCTPPYYLQFWPWPVFLRVDCQLSWHIFVLWSVVLYLAAQCRISTHYSPAPPFPAPSPSYMPLTFPSVGCWLPPPFRPLLFLNAWLPCGASICPPEPRTSSNSVNLRQAAASTLLVLTAWSVCQEVGLICRFALTAKDVDVEMRKCSPERVVDGFPLFTCGQTWWCMTYNQGGKLTFSIHL